VEGVVKSQVEEGSELTSARGERRTSRLEEVLSGPPSLALAGSATSHFADADADATTPASTSSNIKGKPNASMIGKRPVIRLLGWNDDGGLGV
jgi:hypothetical protein